MAEIDSKIDEDDAKAILLNSLSSKYDNAIFTLIQTPFQSFGETIAALMVEEKRIGDTDASPHNELALFSKGRVNKNGIECFSCHKYGHTTLNCKIRDKDLFKGRLKESANVAFSEDSPDAIFEDYSSDNEPSEPSLKLF